MTKLDWLAALEAHNQALAVAPTLVEAYIESAKCWLEVHRFTSAVAPLRRAIALAPSHQGAQNNLAGTLGCMDVRGETMAWFQRSLAIRPQSPDTLANYASALQRFKDFSQAERFHRAALDYEPGRAELWANLARCYADMGYLVEAVEAFTKGARCVTGPGRDLNSIYGLLASFANHYAVPGELLEFSEDSLYSRWLELFEPPRASRNRPLRPIATPSARRPRFTLLILCGGEADALATLQSIENQTLQEYEITVISLAVPFATPTRHRLVQMRTFQSDSGQISDVNRALQEASGEFTAFLQSGMLLSPNCLETFAAAIDQMPHLDVIYSDDDEITAAGMRRRPRFKPDWDIDRLLEQDYIGTPVFIRTELARDNGGFREELKHSYVYDLLLRVALGSERPKVGHVPKVLVHLPRGHLRSDEVEAEQTRVVQERLNHLDASLVVERNGPTRRIRRTLPTPAPLVSIIVPTRDRLPLLRTCLSGLMRATIYPNKEILVVDNDSSEPETLDYLARISKEPCVRVFRRPGAFNFSGLNNYAVSKASGDLLCLMNNDIEIIDASWLNELVSHAVRPEVGAVGPKLLYPNGTIQHAGVVLGAGGVAGHAYAGSPDGAPGHQQRLRVCQQVSAVTGACMVLRKAVYQEVGGLDEQRLRIAYNDIDLCLRLRRAGYALIWSPHAVLRHHESASRSSDTDLNNYARYQGEIATMHKRWGAILPYDPYYNLNCELMKADHFPAFPPRERKG
ncbi:MAG: glycosyltransferase [Proteobacteria bacterium]|nr:glycosyltransferase [Pseudomonadota bacterium]MBI3498484.1 glycosyltransferase [Pseudomonadota bacterium]